MPLERGQLQALETYSALVSRWNSVAKLVARGDLARFAARHLLDSLILAPLIREREGLAGAQKQSSNPVAAAPLPVADFGSGAGLPGVPLAVALPELTFTLIERSEKKARFLRRVRDELTLPNVRVLCADIRICRAAVSVAWLCGRQCRCGCFGRTRGRRWRRGAICSHWTG